MNSSGPVILNNTLGIIGAMREEVQGILELIESPEEVEIGMRAYFTGLLAGRPVVVAFSRWGKVAAATTATTLILEFGVRELLFTGVAGGVHPDLRIGDVVVASRLVQYDMDARPLIPRFEIPLLGITYFDVAEASVSKAEEAVGRALSADSRLWRTHGEELASIPVLQPRVFSGLISSGDRFIGQSHERDLLRELLPDTLCVEMEGAAVAQVGHEYGIPCTIIRTISDTADDRSPVDFSHFIERVASPYAKEIIREWAETDTRK